MNSERKPGTTTSSNYSIPRTGSLSTNSNSFITLEDTAAIERERKRNLSRNSSTGFGSITPSNPNRPNSKTPQQGSYNTKLSSLNSGITLTQSNQQSARSNTPSNYIDDQNRIDTTSRTSTLHTSSVPSRSAAFSPTRGTYSVPPRSESPSKMSRMDRAVRNMVPSDVAMAVFEQQQEAQVQTYQRNHAHKTRSGVATPTMGNTHISSNHGTQSRSSVRAVDTTAGESMDGGKNRRKTAKEIAQMYENLKLKYIDRKKEWITEKRDLLNKLAANNEARKQLNENKILVENLKISLAGEKRSRLSIHTEYETLKASYGAEREDLNEIIQSLNIELASYREELTRIKMDGRTWQAEKENYLNQNKLYENRISDLQLEVIALKQQQAGVGSNSTEDKTSKSKSSPGKNNPSIVIPTHEDKSRKEDNQKVKTPNEQKQQMIRQHMAETKKSTKSQLKSPFSDSNAGPISPGLKLAEPLKIGINSDPILTKPYDITMGRSFSPDPSEISVSSFNTAATSLIPQQTALARRQMLAGLASPAKSSQQNRKLVNREIGNKSAADNIQTDFSENFQYIGDTDEILEENINAYTRGNPSRASQGRENAQKSRSLSNNNTTAAGIQNSRSHSSGHHTQSGASSGKGPSIAQQTMSKQSSQENMLSDGNISSAVESKPALPQLAQKLLFGSKPSDSSSGKKRKDSNASQTSRQNASNLDSCHDLSEVEQALRQTNNTSRTSNRTPTGHRSALRGQSKLLATSTEQQSHQSQSHISSHQGSSARQQLESIERSNNWSRTSDHDTSKSQTWSRPADHEAPVKTWSRHTDSKPMTEKSPVVQTKNASGISSSSQSSLLKGLTGPLARLAGRNAEAEGSAGRNGEERPASAMQLSYNKTGLSVGASAANSGSRGRGAITPSRPQQHETISEGDFKEPDRKNTNANAVTPNPAQLSRGMPTQRQKAMTPTSGNYNSQSQKLASSSRPQSRASNKEKTDSENEHMNKANKRSRSLARMRAELRANSLDFDGETTCDEDGTPMPARRPFGFRHHGPPVRV